MTDFIQGENRFQSTLFPERVDDYIAEDNAVRVIDVSSMSWTFPDWVFEPSLRRLAVRPMTRQ